MSLSKTLYPLLSTGSTKEDPFPHGRKIDISALDKLMGQLGIYANWLSSIVYLQKQLRIFVAGYGFV